MGRAEPRRSRPWLVGAAPADPRKLSCRCGCDGCHVEQPGKDQRSRRWAPGQGSGVQARHAVIDLGCIETSGEGNDSRREDEGCEPREGKLWQTEAQGFPLWAVLGLHWYEEGSHSVSVPALPTPLHVVFCSPKPT